jgi:hypothetical protein
MLTKELEVPYYQMKSAQQFDGDTDRLLHHLPASSTSIPNMHSGSKDGCIPSIVNAQQS